MIPAAWLFVLAGGLLIGSAAALYLLVNGRILGASGILGGLLDRPGRDVDTERLAFVAAVILTPGLLGLVFGRTDTNITSDWTLIVVGGLLVGVGTRIANGCTSGHGVCGMSRLSVRGIAATATFLGSGFAAMALLRHVVGVI